MPQRERVTDLERAVSMVGAWEYATSYDPHVRVTQIANALAAARREERESCERDAGPSLADIQTMIEDAAQRGAEEMRERAERLHEQVYVGHHQDPMAAVIEYRDLIRALKER